MGEHGTSCGLSSSHATNTCASHAAGRTGSHPQSPSTTSFPSRKVGLMTWITWKQSAVRVTRPKLSETKADAFGRAPVRMDGRLSDDRASSQWFVAHPAATRAIILGTIRRPMGGWSKVCSFSSEDRWGPSSYTPAKLGRGVVGGAHVSSAPQFRSIGGGIEAAGSRPTFAGLAHRRMRPLRERRSTSGVHR